MNGSIDQLVDHVAVNYKVCGSSPHGTVLSLFYYILIYNENNPNPVMHMNESWTK